MRWVWLGVMLAAGPVFAQDVGTGAVAGCDLKRVAGLAELRTGHMQVWQVPGHVSGATANPAGAMDVVVLNPALIALLGKAEGAAELTWVGTGPDGQDGPHRCAMPVVADAPLSDDTLCHDPQGQALRLTVGQSAMVHAAGPDGTALEVTEYMLQSPAIAEVARSDDRLHSPIVTGRTPGATSLVLLSGFGADLQVHLCEVVVQ